MTRILFIGGTRRGYLTLKALVENGETVVGVFSLSQHPHESERYEDRIAELSRANRIPIHESRSLNGPEHVDIIKNELAPDVIFVVGCRVMIPKSIYDVPPLGTLAVHDSLLPEYRGFAPLNWSIINGEDYTGITLFHLDEKMDSGDILLQKRLDIDPGATAPEIYEQSCEATVDLVLAALPLLREGTAYRVPQNHKDSTYTCSRAPQDGYIDWSATTDEIYRKVRALAHPYPGAFTYYKGQKLNIWNATPTPYASQYIGRIPGKIVSVDAADGCVDVLTGDSVIRLIRVQLEGEAPAAASQVIRSVRDSLGVTVPQLVERVRTLEEKVSHLLRILGDGRI